jgi:hypothetical protein
MSNPLNLSDNQKLILAELHKEYVYVLAGFQFNDPAEDHMKIRQHAAISGKVSLLAELLDEAGSNAQASQSNFDNLINSQLGQ